MKVDRGFFRRNWLETDFFIFEIEDSIFQMYARDLFDQSQRNVDATIWAADDDLKMGHLADAVSQTKGVQLKIVKHGKRLLTNKQQWPIL